MNDIFAKGKEKKIYVIWKGGSHVFSE